MKKSWILIWLFIFSSLPETIAQNYWKSPPLYDYGNALKRKFIITTPGNMGPNALPVPEIKKGLVGNSMYVKAGGELHFGKGDFTRNAVASLYYPVVPGKVAVEVYGIPYEAYTLSESIKKERRILDVNCEGHTWGDYYFGTIIQVLKDHQKLPDLALALTCKTASGGSLLNARFTDAPAYFFDLSLGRDLLLNHGKIDKLRLYGSGGLYVWQTNSDYHPQDDAILYGLGCETQLGNLRLNQVLAGYHGYLDMRDKPMVIRNQVSWQFPHFNYSLEYQAGLNDYNYNSLKLTVSYFPFRNKEEVLDMLAENQ